MIIDPADRRAVSGFIRERALGVVATVDVRGCPEAALVGLAALDDGTLIFDARADSRKIENITSASDVAVVIGFTDDISIQIEGAASIAVGADRARYAVEYTAQFPGSRALDADFALVTVEVRWVRVYDARQHPALVQESRWD